MSPKLKSVTIRKLEAELVSNKRSEEEILLVLQRNYGLNIETATSWLETAKRTVEFARKRLKSHGRKD